MNVENFEPVAPEAGRDRLELIFERQRELMKKYHDIEQRSGIGHGLLAGRAFDIDDPRSQYLLKDFAWRIMEEIGESREAFRNGDTLHGQEELADALHFLVELCLIVNVNFSWLAEKTRSTILSRLDKWDALDDLFVLAENNGIVGTSESVDLFVENLGVTMNCLKQKPWKTTHVATDVVKFRINLWGTLVAWAVLAHHCGLNPETAFDLYTRKAKVNEFRQGSGY